MTLMVAMWAVWGVLVAAALILHVYQGRLERDDAGQIFLDDSFDHEKTAQAVMVAKVNRIDPYVKTAYWLVAAMTVVVVVYYVWDILVELGVIH